MRKKIVLKRLFAFMLVCVFFVAQTASLVIADDGEEPYAEASAEDTGGGDLSGGGADEDPQPGPEPSDNDSQPSDDPDAPATDGEDGQPSGDPDAPETDGEDGQPSGDPDAPQTDGGDGQPDVDIGDEESGGEASGDNGYTVLLDEDGNPVLDDNGNPVLVDADGNIIPTDENGDPILEDEEIPLAVPGEPELSMQVLYAEIYTDGGYTELLGDDTVITVSGTFPEGAYVRAYPVELELDDDSEVLAAYDITVFDAEGNVIQPEDTAIVNIMLPELPELDEDAELNVLYIPDEDGEQGDPETVETEVLVDVLNGSIEFEDEHFSTYAVTISYSGNTYTLTYSVDGGAIKTATSSSNTLSLKVDGLPATLTISGSSSVTITSATGWTSNGNDLYTREITLAGNYQISIKRGTTNTTLTLNISQQTYNHVDVKFDAAYTEGESAVTVSTLTYIGYSNSVSSTNYTDLTYTDITNTLQWSNTNQEYEHKNTQSGTFTDSTIFKITVTLNNGNTMTFFLTKNTTYLSGTVYSGANARKIATYNGVSYSNGDAVDISGMSIFLVSAIVCDTSTVSKDSVSPNGLDMVLNYETAKSGSYDFILDGKKVLYDSQNKEKDVTASQFQFDLYEANANWVIQGDNPAQTVNVTANGSFSFKAIEYKGLSTSSTVYFYYVVKEKQGADTNYSYSDWTYYVTVKVSTDAQGNSNAAVEYKYSTTKDTNKNEADEVVFYNYYMAGSLGITKEVVNSADIAVTDSYQIYVKTGGDANSLSAYLNGYYIQDEDGITEYTSTQNGYITIKAGETIVIKGLPYNTYFSVVEDDGSIPTTGSVSYGVTGAVPGSTPTTGSASGQIPESTTPVQVTVTNTFYPPNTTFGTSVTAKKEWKDDAGPKPDVTVYLQDTNGNNVTGIVNPVTLSDNNKWTYTWTRLPEGTYIVKEVGVPYYYVAAEPVVTISSSWSEVLRRETSCSNKTFYFNLDEIIIFKVQGDHYVWTPIKLSPEQRTAVNNWLKTAKLTDGKSFDNSYAGSIKDFYDGYGTITNVSGGTFMVKEENLSITFSNSNDWAQVWFGTYDASQIHTITNTFLGYDATIKKVNEEGLLLAGAEFTLEYKNGEVWTKIANDADATNGYFTSGDDGIFTLTGLKHEFYRLTEETAPEGYARLEKLIYFTIDENGIKIVDENKNTLESGPATAAEYCLTITNTLEAFQLPDTGGRGTAPFTAMGMTVMCGAFALLGIYPNSKRQRKRRAGGGE